jgi:hypothetical protein
MSETPTDDELAAMGLPSTQEIRASFGRAARLGAIVRAAGWDRHNPNTPVPVLRQLAEQILDATPGILKGYPPPRTDVDTLTGDLLERVEYLTARLATAKADAWNEGYDAAIQEHGGTDYGIWPNPYRAKTTT